MSNTISFFTLLSIHLLVYLLDGHGKTLRLAFAESSNVYIVYLGERQHNDPKLVTDLHHDMLTNLMGSKELAKESMVYSYRHGFSGFAAKLTASQAQQLSERPDVVGVIPNSFTSCKQQEAGIIWVSLLKHRIIF
ncbi:Subtilisin-like protease SBT3.4 [Sesamum alatum]|uniref:Subtilisin-like protease SBT3.4 n=1 Tax=Sesamum alatum TaxID=300844 RepID=A0AAE2CGL5_9LAMI|nr:Subtilisin-like protease SBT3.4 [Sesamum alatum]